MENKWQEAKSAYCSEKDMTLKAVATQFGLDFAQVRKQSAREGWYRQKCQRAQEVSPASAPQSCALQNSEKINEIAQNLLENIRLSSEDTDKPTGIYNLTSALKNITSILRDVNDLPSLKDRQNYELAKCKLELAKIKSAQEQTQEAGGIVLLPEVAAAEPPSDVCCASDVASQ